MGFQPRKIRDVVAYDKIIQNRKVIFEYHLFDLYLVELERRRRFELNVSRFSYCKDHLRVLNSKGVSICPMSNEECSR